ncbi:MAG: PIN domain-containing protein, partial [Chloroflexia bacterium]
PLTDDVVEQAADIYASLHRTGQLIGEVDTLIAATALVHNLVLVTNNERHFNRVPGLQIENWLK